jgi:hypothetical protein
MIYPDEAMTILENDRLVYVRDCRRNMEAVCQDIVGKGRGAPNISKHFEGSLIRLAEWRNR